MEVPVKKRLNPRKVFWQRGTCSNAMFHLLNHEFDHIKPMEEKASDTLAGGIAQKGHQCGMLWGAALAAGLSKPLPSIRIISAKGVVKASLKYWQRHKKGKKMIIC